MSTFDLAMGRLYAHKSAVVLLEAGADVGKDKKVFDSIRQCECTSNHPIVIRWCEENGADNSCLDDYAVESNRSMFYAGEEGYFDKHSMRDGCSLARDEDGRTMLMCNMDSWSSFCQTAMHLGCDGDTYPDCRGRTLLHHAVLGGSRKVLRQVLKEGADVTAVDENGKTAMMLLQSKPWSMRGDDHEDGDDYIGYNENNCFQGDSDDEYADFDADPLDLVFNDNDSLIDTMVKYIQASDGLGSTDDTETDGETGAQRKRKRNE
jgi:hypothetical protein